MHVDMYMLLVQCPPVYNHAHYLPGRRFAVCNPMPAPQCDSLSIRHNMSQQAGLPHLLRRSHNQGFVVYEVQYAQPLQLVAKATHLWNSYVMTVCRRAQQLGPDMLYVQYYYQAVGQLMWNLLSGYGSVASLNAGLAHGSDPS